MIISRPYKPYRDIWLKAIPVLLFFFNLLLKLWHITSRDIALDEPFTIFHAQAEFSDLFIMLKNENNPPLFFVLLHFWIKIFGISPLSVRFMPVLFSALSAMIIFLLGKRWFSVTAGLVAALLFTFSDFQMVFAHEARVYPLFILLTVLSMLVIFSGSNKKIIPTVVLAGTLNALLIYSHYFGFLVIATQALLLVCLRTLRFNTLKIWLWSLPLTMILYAPYLPWLIKRFTETTGHGTWVEKPVLSDLYTMVWRYSNAPVVTVVFLAIIAAGAAMVLYRRQKLNEFINPFYTAVWVWFLIPYLAMFLVSFRLPLFLDRYTVFITPAYYLLVGVSSTFLITHKGWKYLFPLLVVVVMGFSFHPNTDNRRRLKEAVTTIDSLREPGSLVLICPSWLEYGYAYHHAQDVFTDYHGLRSRLNKEGIFPVDRLAMMDTTLVNQASSIIYFEEWATLTDKENTIYRYMVSRFPVYREHRVFENYVIHHFSR